MFSGGSQSVLAASLSTARPIPPIPAVQPLETVSSHVDIVLVIDNVGEIKTYDPAGGRFLSSADVCESSPIRKQHRSGENYKFEPGDCVT